MPGPFQAGQLSWLKRQGSGSIWSRASFQSLERPERLSTGCRVREVAEFEKFEER
jgi:hypothetical protein